jgi:hypothetical protein
VPAETFGSAWVRKCLNTQRVRFSLLSSRLCGRPDAARFALVQWIGRVKLGAIDGSETRRMSALQKMNLMAVCAAFAFLCAIVVGVF